MSTSERAFRDCERRRSPPELRQLNERGVVHEATGTPRGRALPTGECAVAQSLAVHNPAFAAEAFSSMIDLGITASVAT
jgi:hypothetical protein